MKHRISPSARFIRLKQFVVFMLCNRLADKFLRMIYRGRIPFHRTCIEVPRVNEPSVAAWLYWGFYESAEVRFVQNFVEDSLPVVELGSSLGGVTCQIARRLSGRQKLICVEANPSLIPILKRNLEFNAPSQPVVYYHGAVDYTSAKSSKFNIADDNLVSSRYGAGPVTEVPSIRLSDIILKEQLADYVLVADIEGAEAEIFFEDSDALDKCRLMIVELHETSYQSRLYSVQDLLAYIKSSLGFRLLCQHGSVCVFHRHDSNL